MLTDEQRAALKALGYVDHQIDRVTQDEYPLFIEAGMDEE